MKKIFLLIISLIIIVVISCSKEKTGRIPVSPTTPKPIYDTINLRVAVSDWHLDQWTLVFDGDTSYFTILPKFSTLPGLAAKADSIKADNILSVKIKMGSMALQVDRNNSSRPFSYNLTNAPIGGPNNTIMIHWWDARPAFQLVDSVDLRLKFLK